MSAMKIENNPGKCDILSVSSDVIGYMNEKAGTNYRPEVKANLDVIGSLIGKGYTSEDLKAVVDLKYDQWIENPNEVSIKYGMHKYFYPSVLFGSYFERYFEQAVLVRDMSGWI